VTSAGTAADGKLERSEAEKRSQGSRSRAGKRLGTRSKSFKARKALAAEKRWRAPETCVAEGEAR
jgi:hypothetical protein